MIAAWNGLAMAAFAEASWRIDEPRYRTIAADGRVPAAARSRDAGRPAAPILERDGRVRGAGALEDYTHLAEGLLALYQAHVRRAVVRRARAS